MADVCALAEGVGIWYSQGVDAPQGIPESVKRVFVEYGREGGKASQKRLTAAQRTRLARKAAEVRWGKRRRTGKAKG